jgi:hypothetical protein
MRLRLTILIALFSRGLSGLSLAHQPILSAGTAVDSQHAIQLDDVQISRVAYHEITAGAPQVWLTFEIREPQELKLQLGVPNISRLESYRPAMAIFGPSLPSEASTLPAPEGLGGIAYDSRDVTEPQEFHEPFSGTSSWIMEETTVFLPAAGRYYVVGYSPGNENGKLWIALGEKEQFDADALGSLAADIAAVRDFHEISATGALPCFLFPFALAGFAGILRVQRRRTSGNLDQQLVQAT